MCIYIYVHICILQTESIVYSALERDITVPKQGTRDEGGVSGSGWKNKESVGVVFGKNDP
jgi:hypothetical protein